MKTKTLRNIRFILGTVQGGSTYLFTGLPEFKTEAAADGYIATHRMNGTVIVFRQAECWKSGVNYGTDFRPAVEVLA